MPTSQRIPSKLVGLGLTVLLMGTLVACGGPPKWVQHGSGAFNEKDTKAFYGVGAVTGVRNAPLAWDTAENRGRAEIAKTFETYKNLCCQAFVKLRRHAHLIVNLFSMVTMQIHLLASVHTHLPPSLPPR